MQLWQLRLLARTERPRKAHLSSQNDIRSAVEARGIDYLLHFTSLDNLRGIARYGLLARSEHPKFGVTPRYSGRYRLDSSDDAISVSICTFNERMFAAKRARSDHFEWIFLAIQSSVLWTQPSRFFWCNAARTEMIEHRGRRDVLWAFEKMFERNPEARVGLYPNQPTDQESEVQVMRSIAPELISGIIVAREELVTPVARTLAEENLRPIAVYAYPF